MWSDHGVTPVEGLFSRGSRYITTIGLLEVTMKVLVVVAAMIGAFSSNAALADWAHVTSQSNQLGTVDVFVENAGLATERWRFEVHSFSDGENYSLQMGIDGQSFTFTGNDISGFFQNFGTFPVGVVTLNSAEFPGVQLGTNGYYYFPPGVRPPTHVEGNLPYIRRRIHKEGGALFELPPDIQIMNCVGAAMGAIGNFIMTGGAWRAGVSGFARGTMSLNLATASIMGAAMATLGATVVAVDACRQE